MPTTKALEIFKSDLYRRDGANNAVGIYISNVTDTIFGQDAHDYDFIVHPEPEGAVEAVHLFDAAWATGDESKILVAFLNVTMFGTMTPAQAADTTWLCGELDDTMKPNVNECAGVQKRDTIEASVIEKRSIWNWVRSTRHVSSQFAMNVLAGVLGNAIYSNLPTSPRNWCTSGGGPGAVIACISWSAVEAFPGYLAQEMVQDAISSQDLNTYSVQANKVLGSKKRSAADVCLSNRPTGCT